MTPDAGSSHPHAAPVLPGSQAASGERPGTRRYRIAEAARRTGVSTSALRLWERQGLIRPVRTDARYRLYSEDDLERLRRIRRLRAEEHVNAPGIRRILAAGVVGAASPDGARLRQLRIQRGLSLRAAAARADLSVSFISALERGATTSSVAALQRLTAAYGTTVLGLFGPRMRGRRLVRSGERPMLRLANSAVRIEQLAATGSSRLEPQLFVLAPGATSDGAYAHEGEEFLYVLDGAVTIWIAEEECYPMTEGDALSFPSTLPHRWRNDASGETRLLWINTPPTF